MVSAEIPQPDGHLITLETGALDKDEVRLVKGWSPRKVEATDKLLDVFQQR